MQKIALIPAYCPEDRMIGLIKELHDRGFAVVIVDDGSGTEYDAVFEAATSYADVRRYTPNRGKGEALKYGLRYIKEQFSAPFSVVTADADGQHRVEDIVKVSDVSAQHPDSLILGKRNLDKFTPIKSRIGNNISRVLYHLTTGRNIVETQTGLRGFSDQLLSRFLNLPGHRYEYEIDMILDASDLDIIEVDIQTVYFDNNAASHFRPFQDTVSLDKEFFRYKLPSLISGCISYLLFVILTLVTKTWLLPSVAARIVSLLLTFLLDKAIPFSEKPPVGRYLITSIILLICDTAAMWGLTALGMNLYAAKIISCLLTALVSCLFRRLFMRAKFHQ